MAKRSGLRSRDELRPDDLLRLVDACEIIFQGVLTPAALRREAARGNLVLERIAGKDFVTPAELDRMRERCRLRPATDKSSARSEEGDTSDREAARRSKEALDQLLAIRRNAYRRK